MIKIKEKLSQPPRVCSDIQFPLEKCSQEMFHVSAGSPERKAMEKAVGKCPDDKPSRRPVNSMLQIHVLQNSGARLSCHCDPSVEKENGHTTEGQHSVLPRPTDIYRQPEDKSGNHPEDGADPRSRYQSLGLQKDQDPRHLMSLSSLRLLPYCVLLCLNRHSIY